MKNLAIGGTFAMVMVNVRDLAENPEVSIVSVANVNIEKTKKTQDWIENVED